MWVINSNELLWKDALNDQGHEQDQWLHEEGGTSTHFDIKEFRVTSDDQNLYFLVTFNDMSNIQLGYNGATFLDIAIDYKDGGNNWLAGNPGLQTSIAWDYQVVVNLADPTYHSTAATVNLTNPGDWGKIFYIVNSNWQQLAIPGAEMSVNISNNAIEIALPLSMFGGNLPQNLKIAVMTAPGWADGDGNGGVWGEAFDFVSDKSSDEEKADGVLNYYIDVPTEQIMSHSPISVDGNPNEWTGEFIIPRPILTLNLTSSINDVEPNQPANITISISNIGDGTADSVNVTLYDNDIKVKNWTVTVPAKGKINLNYIYEYNEQKTGTHHLKAIVEYEGKNITASYKLYVGEIEIRRQNLMTAGMYIWPGLYMKRYEWSVNALEMAKGMATTNESMNQINLLEKKLKENYRLFKKGFTLLQGNNPSPRGAFIVASAYYKIKGIQKEISELLKKLEAEGVMNKVTKVAEDMQHGEAGANLTALYLGSDDKYYYVVVDTGNTENWDVAYGIAIDAKDGGYNGTSDAWGRNLWFSFKADYEIYIYWSSEDNSIAATSFAEWNSGEWKYSKPSEAGIKVSYTKGSGGIKRLIFQIPLSLIPDPENAKVSAFVTGADPGTSAVDCLPYDRSINDQANEWNDLDWITTYATPNGTGSELPSEITIDGALADWQNAKVMIKEKNLNYAGANLAMLGVDYDENYLYIALEANNSENWDLSYGIALDVKDGGYTTGRDAWGKLIGFTEGVDYEIYGWWNSGTKRLEYNFGKDTGMQLVKYEDGKWTYDWNKQFKGFKAAYFGGTSGLQTVEIGIPWEAIDGRPKEVKVIAWIAGGDNTSAVVTVPDDKAVHDSTDEWKDTDTLSNFVKVMIK